MCDKRTVDTECGQVLNGDDSVADRKAKASFKKETNRLMIFKFSHNKIYANLCSCGRLSIIFGAGYKKMGLIFNSHIVAHKANVLLWL